MATQVRIDAVALITSSFAPHVGGVEEVVRRLAAEQISRGIDSFVIANRYPASLPEREVVEGIDVHRERFRMPVLRPRPLLGWVTETRATVRRIEAAISARHADLVHVHCVSSNGYYALRAARRLDLPLVVSLHGELTMDADGIYERSRVLRRTWRALLDEAVAVTGCSQQVIDEAAAVYGPNLYDKSTVILNGIDVSRVRSAPPEVRSRPYVLGIGRLVRAKGFDLLIDAFAEVAKDYPDIDLVIAGDGQEATFLQHKADVSGLAGRITFTGLVSSDRAYSLFRGASVFVLPSRHEPQGIVLLEAMAAGTPIVAAHVGGVPEVIKDGVNGLLFAGSSATDLSTKLRAVLSDRKAAMTRSTQAGSDVEERTWQHAADLFDEAYATVRR